MTAADVLRVKAALSKAACWPWPLTFWSWKWCSSHVWPALPLCQFQGFHFNQILQPSHEDTCLSSTEVTKNIFHSVARQCELL